MSWCVHASVRDSFRWRCRRKTSASRCNVSTSIRHGSWYTRSNLNFMEVLFLTYDIVRRVPSQCIQLEYNFSKTTISDWAQLCRKAMLDYVESSSQKIGGPIMVPRDSLLPSIHHYTCRRTSQVSTSLRHYGRRVTDYVCGMCPLT
jgi:hypothetical protein